MSHLSSRSDRSSSCPPSCSLAQLREKIIRRGGWFFLSWVSSIFIFFHSFFFRFYSKNSYLNLLEIKSRYIYIYIFDEAGKEVSHRARHNLKSCSSNFRCGVSAERREDGVRITLRGLARPCTTHNPLKVYADSGTSWFMKTGWTSLGSAARVPPRPWRVVPRLDFLFPLLSSLSLSLSLSREWRNGIIRWTTTKEEKKSR